MPTKNPPWVRAYDAAILKRPKAVLLSLLALFSFFAYWIKDFRLDASSDSLVLEHDDDIRYYREVSSRYESGDFVVVTYTPPEALFSRPSLDRLKRLRDELRGLKRVASVVSLLDVPLLKNPPGTLADLKDNIKTLESEKADMAMAVSEFRNSPIYSNLIVSPTLKTTALQVNFKSAGEGEAALWDRRSALGEKRRRGKLSPEQQAEWEGLSVRYRSSKDARRNERHEDIRAIREIIERYRDEAQLHLGGVPMIVDDILAFIRSDLKIFGLGMLCFLILALGMIFRSPRWIFLPMLCCASSAVTMMGLLGLLSWDVTVVSSNFISLQLIFTMSLAIHIVVRYRELLRNNPGYSARDLALNAVRHTFVPCLYASLTTVAGFVSLVVCDILPVVNFGWMMTLGLCVSQAITFTLLPAALMLMEKPVADKEKDFGLALTAAFARATEHRGPAIFTISVVLAAATLFGMTKIEVENSFVDYFKKSTEIYQGMKFVDQELGGTTPLDIMLNFPAEPRKAPPAAKDGDSDFEDFAEFEKDDAGDASKYWFNTVKLARIHRVHEYLDGLPSTGKVLSLATLWKTTEELNEGKPFDDFTLALLFSQMPEQFQGVLIRPYVSVENNQARVTTRVKDSMRGLRRDALIKQIRRDMAEKLGLREDEFRVTGLMVLYNNMLQSLFDSQIKTIGFTVLALMAMFLLLFRSLKIALIAIFPNLMSSLIVLGVMGLGGIPLDVMTITIVAISVGIAVDDTIHYLHRFKREIAKDWDYVLAMHRCHASIGSAMYYTSLTIVIGFSILAFSNFIPTMLFGLLTALAMAMALASALSLLPRLIIVFRPFGDGRAEEKGEGGVHA